MINPTTVVITDTALADYSRIVGCTLDAAARDALGAQFSRAHFVKTLNSGAELWRGSRPRRLAFVVHLSGDGPVVSRVMPEHRGVRRPDVPFRLTVKVDGAPVVLDLVDVVYEPGGDRRVAYKFPDGRWAEALRGARLGEVAGFRLLDDMPGWARSIWGVDNLA